MREDIDRGEAKRKSDTIGNKKYKNVSLLFRLSQREKNRMKSRAQNSKAWGQLRTNNFCEITYDEKSERGRS